MKTIRWGIIGCGAVTEQKSGPAYQKTEGFTIQGVTRRDLAKAEDYAKRHAIPLVFPDAQSLINSPEIDAVYIATPPDTHKQFAMEVAAAGKPCCIEKPMTPRHDESLDVISAFSTVKQPLFVAYYRRSLPRFLQVKKWLDEGKIGTPRHLSWQLSKPTTEQDRAGTYNWRTDSKIALGGYFDDLASHGFDLFNFLLGDIEEVHGIATNQQGNYKAFDALSACWKHPKNITGSGSWNFGSRLHEDHAVLYGSEGEIHFSIFLEAPISLHTADETQQLTIEHPENVQLPFVQAMAKTLLEGVPHPSSGKSGAHASWVLDQILL